jgi:hypothetical protein
VHSIKKSAENHGGAVTPSFMSISIYRCSDWAIAADREHRGSPRSPM